MPAHAFLSEVPVGTYVTALPDANGHYWQFSMATNGAVITTDVGTASPGAAPYASLADLAARVLKTDLPNVTLNANEPYYGDWLTIGNAPGSIGFGGTPSAAPATTVAAPGVTLPLSNGTVPVADTAQLNANGGGAPADKSPRERKGA